MADARARLAAGAGSIRVGLAALAANPLRTFLSTLGIIVGTAALVSVLALGDGVERYVRRQIERTTDLQTVAVTPRTFRVVDRVTIPRTDYPVFTRADAESARVAVGGIGAVALTVTGPALIERSGAAPRAAIVTATLPSIVEFQRIALSAGRFFTATESRVAVISANLGLAIGDSLTLNGRTWAVVGVIAPGDEPPSASLVFVPIGSADSAMVSVAGRSAPVLLIKAARVEDVDSIQARVGSWLERRYGSEWRDKVRVGTRAERLAQVQQGLLVFKILMGAITGISLLVGGIGIMNVLLASVAERTREIGVRKAAGARRRDILWQFLAESLAITGTGSVVGAVLGLTGAFGITAIMRARTEAVVYAAFTWSTLLVAAAAAVVIGVAFGMYPALRAARLSPIDAMRHET
jgi:putative ABC transport system permease protein